MLKRIMAFLLAAASLVTLAGCKKKKPSLVENEKNAKEVIECPSDNMYGLEKIVVFEDRAVAVFDEKICEDFEYDEHNSYPFSLKSYLDVDEPGFRLSVDNMVEIWPDEDESKIELKDGHYVVTIIFPNKESYKEDPDEDFVIVSMTIGGIYIRFDDSSIELEYVARGCDIMWYYTQEFNRKTGKWTNVDEDEVGCMTEAMDY